MKISKRRFLQIAMATPLAGFLTSPALAAKPQWFDVDGIAIRGYDPVAYFKVSAPVKGKPEFALDFDGVIWHFSSAENLLEFTNDPWAYAPQFGGYCAYAVSKGGTATTQPDAWTVWNGKLYLNFKTTVRGILVQDIPGNVAKAEANWPGVLA